MPFTYTYKTLGEAGGSDYSETTGKLMTPVNISFTGDASGNVLFDGSQDVSVELSVSAIPEEDLEAMLV